MSADHAEPAMHGDAPTAAEPSMLVDRRELALVAFERTRMPMVVSDPAQPDAPIVLANEAFLKLTGYSSDEVLGRNCRFLQGPGTDPKDIDTIRRGLAEGHDVEVEMLNYRKDGTPFINQLAISPVLGNDGALLYYFGSQKDVTERRRVELLEQTERRLLLEIDHRTMNSMAVVQSIVRMSRGDTLQSYATSIQGRVDALARAHRLLARSSWEGASLEDLISAQREYVPDGTRILIGGPPVSLVPKLVQPLALVLHELTSNAVEHGALAQPEGSVTIRWSVENARAILNWQEQGGAPVPVQIRPGFGLGMINGVVQRQLGGETMFDWSEQGLCAKLSFDIEAPKQTFSLSSQR